MRVAADRRVAVISDAPDVPASLCPPTPAEPPGLAVRRAAIAAAVGLLGWDLHHLEIDRERGRLLCDVRRGDRRVELRVTERGASVERWHRDTRTVRVGTRRRDSMLYDVPDDRFLGRQRYASPAEAVAGLADYLVANGDGRSLPAGVVARQFLAAAEETCS